MIYVLCGIIIVLLIVVIVLLIVRRPNNNNVDISKINDANMQTNVQMQSLSSNVQNLSQLNATQLQNMNAQLNNVYQSLGEMKSMSSDIENLSKVLANVKSRGTFAEVQLERILESTIAGMYEKNVKPNPRSNKIVEFAIKIPNGSDGQITWLPIDSKFPMDQYAKLVEASEGDDPNYVESCRRFLISEIDKQATKIKDSYICVPYTTNFAVMYLPTEGMYMEAVTDPDGLQYKLQERGIMLAGPSTILALLNSLSMGFNMIKINKNADEIRRMLGNIKTQFSTFDENLNQIDKGLNTALGSLDKARERTRLINNSLDRIDSEE